MKAIKWGIIVLIYVIWFALMFKMALSTDDWGLSNIAGFIIAIVLSYTLISVLCIRFYKWFDSKLKQ